jgi:hypothetical protein
MESSKFRQDTTKMFKGTSRFLQSLSFKDRSLSGYPKSRGLSAPNLLSSQGQFDVGTAYVREIAPLIHHFLNSGLMHSDIADELHRRGIATPSGNPWSETLAAELVEMVKSTDKKHVKRPHRTKIGRKNGRKG